MWDKHSGGVHPEIIKKTNIKTFEDSASQAEAFKTYQELVNSFTSSCNMLRSDGEVLLIGTLKKTSGMLLTEARVLTVLRDHGAQKAQAEKEKQERAVKVEAGRLHKEHKVTECQRQRVHAEREKRFHVLWLDQRPQRARVLALT